MPSSMVRAFALCACLTTIAVAKPLPSRNYSDNPAKNPQLPQRHLRPHQTTSLRSAVDQFPEEETTRIIAVECSETPLFMCSTCGPTEQEQNECNSCRQRLQDEQTHVIHQIMTAYPTGASVLAVTKKLHNSIFVEITTTKSDHDVDRSILDIQGVKQVHPHDILQVTAADASEYIGGLAAQEDFCLNGGGVRIAVIDTGIDYTHEAIGGPGTVAAYEAAYGTGPSSPENKNRDGLFPTDTVVDGYDFLGDTYVQGVNVETDADPDDDPIDGNGHGTLVASAILAVAPGAQLVALKACTTTGTCPNFAVLQALEYALDPNDDGATDDKVDIVCFSLGGRYLSPYYSSRTNLLESLASLGVVPVIAAGNNADVPYIIGPAASSPNALSVAGTRNAADDILDVVGSYSSRGPGEANMLKPDIAAPGKLTVARGGSGNGYSIVTGTSTAAPLVAGSVALLKERCPTCSQLALRAILMNNVFRGIRYDASSNEGAPLSLVGSGEVRVYDSLDADFWAYSEQDVQPSISLGIVNAASNIVIQRTIRVTSLTTSTQTLSISSTFVSASQEALGAVQVVLPVSQVSLAADCSDTADNSVAVEVEFHIDASLAPPNYMSSVGPAGLDPTGLNKNEFGGHIIIQSSETGKEISVPFYMLLRQAADVVMDTNVLIGFNGEPTEVPVGIANVGAGVAQIDFYELLLLSQDEGESSFGTTVVPNDFRYIGYRVLEVNEPTCTYLFEFAFNTWERRTMIMQEFFEVLITTSDGDFLLYNSRIFDGEIQCLVYNYATEETQCTGFTPDHSTNTANTVLRVCSDDLGITEPGSIIVQFAAVSRADGTTQEFLTDSGSAIEIDYPQEWVSAPSYDIYPGSKLDSLPVDGTNPNTYGLLMLTNSYRNSDSTGAAIPGSEAIVLLTEFFQSYFDDEILIFPDEVTPDVLTLPTMTDMTGPECLWKDSDCSGVRALEGVATGTTPLKSEEYLDAIPDRSYDATVTTRQLQTECTLVDIPRATVTDVQGSSTASPTTTSPTTASPTTAMPTTASPTTASPTTASPTTASPTTSSPTIAMPTTASPTTVMPTTVIPTTAMPTTVMPITASPTTAMPTTASPTTAMPTTASPTAAIPTTASPTAASPTTVSPTAASPTTASPTTAMPTTPSPTAASPTVEDGPSTGSETSSASQCSWMQATGLAVYCVSWFLL